MSGRAGANVIVDIRPSQKQKQKPYTIRAGSDQPADHNRELAETEFKSSPAVIMVFIRCFGILSATNPEIGEHVTNAMLAHENAKLACCTVNPNSSISPVQPLL